jgi:hypothetical protein
MDGSGIGRRCGVGAPYRLDQGRRGLILTHKFPAVVGRGIRRPLVSGFNTGWRRAVERNIRENLRAESATASAADKENAQ